MSNHGVDLLRSDTGHYMQWPLDEDAAAPAAQPVAAPTAVPAHPQPVRHANRGRSWVAALAPSTPAASGLAPAAAAAVPLSGRDQVGRVLSLVNWFFLLLLFCVFLLAKTLPLADAALPVGATSQSPAVPHAAPAATHR